MTDTAMLLWTDTESTGLLEDPQSPTGLEFSWTISNADGVQLTPLCQVFMAIPLLGLGNPVEPIPAPLDTTVFDTPTIGYWDSKTYPDQYVREMHEGNGLTNEHARMQDEHPDRILRGWGELERLMLDDLREAGFYDMERHQVQLAGAGVAHYEQRFLPEALPRVFEDSRFHYATHDVSGILRGLRVADKRVPDKIDGLLKAALGQPTRSDGWAHIALSPTRYDADDRCTYDAADNRTLTHWALREKADHRAGSDVARSLMAHRLLPMLPSLVSSAA